MMCIPSGLNYALQYFSINNLDYSVRSQEFLKGPYTAKSEWHENFQEP
jgi:hypothetical protein